MAFEQKLLWRSVVSIEDVRETGARWGLAFWFSRVGFRSKVVTKGVDRMCPFGWDGEGERRTWKGDGGLRKLA